MKNLVKLFGNIVIVALIGFSMAACDGDGNGDSNGDHIPATPTGLTATMVSSNQIDLSWDTVSGTTGYYIYRSANSSGPYDQIATATANSYSNTGLAANTTY